MEEFASAQMPKPISSDVQYNSNGIERACIFPRDWVKETIRNRGNHHDRSNRGEQKAHVFDKVRLIKWRELNIELAGAAAI